MLKKFISFLFLFILFPSFFSFSSAMQRYYLEHYSDRNDPMIQNLERMFPEMKNFISPQNNFQRNNAPALENGGSPQNNFQRNHAPVPSFYLNLNQLCDLIETSIDYGMIYENFGSIYGNFLNIIRFTGGISLSVIGKVDRDFFRFYTYGLRKSKDTLDEEATKAFKLDSISKTAFRGLIFSFKNKNNDIRNYTLEPE